ERKQDQSEKRANCMCYIKRITLITKNELKAVTFPFKLKNMVFQEMSTKFTTASYS
ncbi:hypothetical protein ACJX0J_016810, partial [Zea mays]